MDAPASSGSLKAAVKITQAQGYRQAIEIPEVRVEAGQEFLNIQYPLIDDGRYDASHGTPAVARGSGPCSGAQPEPTPRTLERATQQ